LLYWLPEHLPHGAVLPRCQARSRDKAGMGAVLNWGQARGPAARHRGHSELIQGGARKWQNQSPMTGRRSMIACSKSGRNSPPFPDRAQSATAWAGYPTSRTVDTLKRLVMPFAGSAITRWIGPHPGTSPADDKKLGGSGADLCLYATKGLHSMKALPPRVRTLSGPLRSFARGKRATVARYRPRQLAPLNGAMVCERFCPSGSFSLLGHFLPTFGTDTGHFLDGTRTHVGRAWPIVVRVEHSE